MFAGTTLNYFLKRTAQAAFLTSATAGIYGAYEYKKFTDLSREKIKAVAAIGIANEAQIKASKDEPLALRQAVKEGFHKKEEYNEIDLKIQQGALLSFFYSLHLNHLHLDFCKMIKASGLTEQDKAGLMFAPKEWNTELEIQALSQDKKDLHLLQTMLNRSGNFIDRIGTISSSHLITKVIVETEQMQKNHKQVFMETLKAAYKAQVHSFIPTVRKVVIIEAGIREYIDKGCYCDGEPMGSCAMLKKMLMTELDEAKSYQKRKWELLKNEQIELDFETQKLEEELNLLKKWEDSGKVRVYPERVDFVILKILKLGGNTSAEENGEMIALSFDNVLTTYQTILEPSKAEKMV